LGWQLPVTGARLPVPGSDGVVSGADLEQRCGVNRKLVLLALLVAVSCKFAEDKKAGRTAAAGASAGASSGASSGSATRITVRGSEAMRAMASKLGAAYAKEHRGVTVDVGGGGTPAGFAALASGQADIAQASRHASEQERADIQSKRGAAPVETPVAFDSVAIYVNDLNPVKQLSTRQIDAIVTGAITNWKEVGGVNTPIVVYGEANSAGFTTYLGGAGAPPKPFRDFADARGTIAAVAGDPNGIAYAGYIPTKDARVLWIGTTDGGPVTAPSEKSVLDRTYPLSAQLYFYTLPSAPKPVQDFIAWTRSAAAKKPLEDAGFVPAR
jgi:phosphate transport system substrate-binding protein